MSYTPQATATSYRKAKSGLACGPSDSSLRSEVIYPRRRYGITMAILVTLLWGFLPIFIKVALASFSLTFVTGARLSIAFVCLFALLALRGKKPWVALRRPPFLAFVAAGCLLTNYLTYNVAIRYGSPALAQVLIQTGALFLVLYGIFLFRERLRAVQWCGIALAGLGLVLFSEDYATNTTNGSAFWAAFGLLVLSGFAWASYAALQRHISQGMNAQLLNVIVFGLGSLALLPTVSWPALSSLTPGLIGLIVFLGLNTMLAYMALAEALLHAPVSQVSMVITLNPLLTLLGMRFVERLGFNGVYPEPFGVVGYAGALLVVLGVIVVVANKERVAKAT